MSRMNKYLAVNIATVLAFSSVGCGQGFRNSGSSNAGVSQSVNVNDQLAKAQAASEQAQKAMADANTALADIMDDKGNIKLGLFSTTSSDSQTRTAGLLAPIIDKLNAVFDKLFAKVDLVKQQFAMARAALNDALSKLSAADPAQAAQIDQIKQELASIDTLEQQFSNQMHSLASKLDLASSAIDKLLQTATSAIPVPGLGTIAGVLVDMFLMSDVKNLIASIKAKLLAI
jgi:hypothetical protein